MFDNKKLLVGGITAALGLLALVVGLLLGIQSFSTPSTPPIQLKAAQEEIGPSELSYEGENGKTALQLLEQQGIVEKNSTGMVININNRKADDKKKEYWAFYINGQKAEVGPAEYQTQDSDTIRWKIEHY